ncbi:MAG: hypothetical protein CFE21_22170 [Bacteroidetes bacterium B1(2017)]|nr:MAG: hypothetical protein CFE21_22170 [Bacteroidetes bacterium B1(2017)]
MFPQAATVAKRRNVSGHARSLKNKEIKNKQIKNKMSKATLIISSIVGILTFCLGWFLHDMKRFPSGINKVGKKIDSLQKPNQKWSTIFQEQLASKSGDFSVKIIGRFFLKGANSAGFDFINSSTVLWTNEIAPSQPDTLKIRWLDNSTFMTRSTERINMDCPPLVSVYQVIFYDGQRLILREIWTGWNEHEDERIEFIKKIK